MSWQDIYNDKLAEEKGYKDKSWQDIYKDQTVELPVRKTSPVKTDIPKTTEPMASAGSSAKGGFSTGAMRASANGGGVVNAPAVVNAQKQASAWDNENKARFGNIRSAADYKEKSAVLLSPAEEKRKENYNRLMNLAGERAGSPVTGFSTNDRKALYELAPQGGIVNREKLERTRAEQTVDTLKSLKATDEEIADFIYLQNTRGDEEAAAGFQPIENLFGMGNQLITDAEIFPVKALAFGRIPRQTVFFCHLPVAGDEHGAPLDLSALVGHPEAPVDGVIAFVHFIRHRRSQRLIGAVDGIALRPWEVQQRIIHIHQKAFNHGAASGRGHWKGWQRRECPVFLRAHWRADLPRR